MVENALAALVEQGHSQIVVALPTKDAGWTQADGVTVMNTYQRQGWERDNGIRIDHALLSPQAADLLRDAGIDRDQRGTEKPSDHVPIWIELDA